MKTNKLFILGLSVLSILFTNCDNKEETTSSQNEFNFGATVARNFKGKIVDENNNPIANATVTLNGYEVVTNSSGIFSYVNASVKERFAYFTAKKEGFLNGSRTVMTHDGLNELTIMLLTPKVDMIQAGEISTVTVGNTSIKFDGAFTTESGEVYNGTVKVLSADLPANDPKVFDKMPGSLLAIDSNGNYKGLETFGMVNVELYGSDNQKLQLTEGHTAKITMDIATQAQQAIAPNVMPMWYFDVKKGVWVEEGFSERIGNKYVGNVSHFTVWNNDWAYPVATLNVVVTNADGTPVQGVKVEIFRPSVTAPADHWNVPLISLGTTGSNGTLSAGVPYNEVFVFRAYNVNGILINTQELPASTLANRTVYVVIPFNDRVATTKKN